MSAGDSECPACRERGSKRGLAMWEWAQAWPTSDGGVVWSPRDIAGERGWGLLMHGWIFACRPCPECSVGVPTGRMWSTQHTKRETR